MKSKKRKSKIKKGSQFCKPEAEGRKRKKNEEKGVYVHGKERKDAEINTRGVQERPRKPSQMCRKFHRN